MGESGKSDGMGRGGGIGIREERWEGGIREERWEGGIREERWGGEEGWGNQGREMGR